LGYLIRRSIDWVFAITLKQIKFMPCLHPTKSLVSLSVSVEPAVRSKSGMYRLMTVFCAAAVTMSSVMASESNTWSSKFTTSFYATDHERNAVDINLRANNGPHTLWIGQYDRGQDFKQTRTGYEYTANYDWWQVVPSFQLAEGGFVGGSLGLQIGNPVYLIAGFGRTNLRNYYNLNFDPNDMVTWGLGARLDNGHQVSVFTVQDNRLATGQMITHGVWRWQASHLERWTLDIAHKEGRSSPGEPWVAGNSVSVGYDRGPHFVRLAFDQKVNFSDNNQARLAVGLRF